jgi:hypothetical protein
VGRIVGLAREQIANITDILVPFLEFSASFFFGASLTICGLRVPFTPCRPAWPDPGGPGSIPGTTRKKTAVGLERGPLSLVSTTEELLDRKVAAPV